MNAKKIAAEKAVDYISDGMVVGLGTGSTAFWAIQKIGGLVKEGLRIQAIATSLQTEALAKEFNIPLTTFEKIDRIDVSIDGADEIDKDNNLIKGGGGALLREKIVAYNSNTFIVVADETKRVAKLGKFPLPIEVVPFGCDRTMAHIGVLGATCKIRQLDRQTFVTDNGNYIVDAQFAVINDPAAVNDQLHKIPGVVETGLFINGLVNNLIIGLNDGSVISL